MHACVALPQALTAVTLHPSGTGGCGVLMLVVLSTQVTGFMVQPGGRADAEQVIVGVPVTVGVMVAGGRMPTTNVGPVIVGGMPHAFATPLHDWPAGHATLTHAAGDSGPVPDVLVPVTA